MSTDGILGVCWAHEGETAAGVPVYELIQKNWKGPSLCLDQEWFVVGVSLGCRWFVVLFLFVCSEGIIFVTYC